MKLLFVVTEDRYFVSHRLPLAVAAKRLGFDVAVATRAHEHSAEIELAGIRVIPIKLNRRSRNPFRELSSVIELMKIYRREKPDIVHHVAIKPVIYGSFSARLMGVPKIVNAVAGLGFVFISKSRKTALLRYLIIRLLRFLFSFKNTQVIVQNADDFIFLKSVLNVTPTRLSLIRGAGVNLDTFSVCPQPKNVPVVVLPARMLKDKGVLEFVAAAKLLRQQAILARFILVGDVDLANPATLTPNTLKKWDSDGVVEWWGYHQDMASIYAQSNIVCLPSYREGLPKVLLEAAASGRALVSTDVPGCREVVRDGLNGLLVPVGDSVSLANALKKLILNPLLCEGMGRAGRKIVEQDFSEAQVIAETIQVYQVLLAREAL